MKYLLTFICVLITSTYADGNYRLGPIHPHENETPPSDATVYSQPFNGGLTSAVSIFSAAGRRACDDFILDDDYYISEVLVWMLYSGPMSSVMNLAISEDDTNDSDPNTNTEVWSESVPCTNTFTGYSQWGYDIYETYCTIDTGLYPELEEGVHYYFDVQAENVDNSFICVSDNLVGDCLWYDDGSGVWVICTTIFGEEMDLFFCFYGEPISALETETWGSIKTLF